VACTSNLHKKVDDQYCTGDKPASEKKCGSPCSWFITAWSQCPGGKGEMTKQERTAKCVLGESAEGEGVKDEDCESISLAKPPLEQECCNPKTEADFESEQCGTVKNGCSDSFEKDIQIGECGSSWVCKENKCECESRPIMSDNPVLTDFVNDFGGPINFICPDGQAMQGVEATHSDPHEDRRWKFTCGELKAPAKLGECETVTLCGSMAEGEAKCPAESVLVGMKAAPPSDEDRTFSFKCCKMETKDGGEVTVEEEGSSEMSEKQVPLKFESKNEWGKASQFLTGVESKFADEKVDRLFKWSWAKFSTKEHCSTCSVGGVKFEPSQFSTGFKNTFSADLDFKCPDGEVIHGMKAEFVAERFDSKVNLKCSKINGTTISGEEAAKPAKCTKDAPEWTATKKDFYLECPRNSVIIGIKSRFVVDEEDREFKVTCAEVEDISGYLDKSLGSAVFGETATWSFDAGNAAVDAIASYYRPGEQRRFKFYTSAFTGKRECTSEWKKGGS